jgi:ubiquinone/menaquinone biosynthesis C-methylase UbiE
VRDPKGRFSDRVDDYVRFRPGYPSSILQLLASACGLGPGRVVADVGSGTGIFTRLLLDSGARVIGVEPNTAMRIEAERALGENTRFESVDGSAESTMLAPCSVDLITAAQAFHWFDPTRARVEFQRVLRPLGFAVLIWNQRQQSPFNRDYEEMLEHFATEYAQVRERDRAAEPKVRAFFSPTSPKVAPFSHEQRFDEAGLRGRLMSSSYAPRPGQPFHEPMMRRLGEIFSVHGRAGQVTFGYEAIVWYGQLR